MVIQMAKQLKTASSKNDAPIWSKLAQLVQKPSSAKKVVNLTQINDKSKENDAIVVPGKILATGKKVNILLGRVLASIKK